MLTYTLLVLLSSWSLSTSAQTVHFPVYKRSPFLNKTPTESDWKALRESTLAKFTPTSNRTSGGNGARRRATSANIDVTDLGGDSTYFATLSIGTPGKNFNVILDTGSSDLFIASSQCRSCGNVPSYDPSSSSSAQQSSQPVDLQYGSGEATGVLTQDTVSMGGFTVSNQQFVLAQDVTDGLLQGSISGLMGLAFQTIAETRAVPFAQQLANSNQLSAPEMSFYLQREIDNENAPQEAPGGKFTLGGTDSSLMSGDIDFVNMPSNIRPSFWILPVTAVGVQGKSLNVNAGTQSLAAIDTGTTLIGGPTQAVASIYQNIQGSQPLSGQMQGYFSIPCSTSVSTSFTFGSKTWNISPADFTVQQLDRQNCLGAIFGFPLGEQGGPDWVIGDAFLKNVYSVFRFTPPSIGFANLASNLQGSPPPSNPPPSSIPSRPPPTQPTSGSPPSSADPSAASAVPPSGTLSIGGGPLPTVAGGNPTVGGGNGGSDPFSTSNPGFPGSPGSGSSSGMMLRPSATIVLMLGLVILILS